MEAVVRFEPGECARLVHRHDRAVGFQAHGMTLTTGHLVLDRSGRCLES